VAVVFLSRLFRRPTVNKTFRLGHLRALVVALVAANGALSLAGSYSLEALRGQLDVSKCKNCVDTEVSYAECGHFNPGEGTTGCSGTWCIEGHDYYSKCDPGALVRSDNPCTMTATATVPFLHQVVHVPAAALACAETRTDPNDGFTFIPNWPSPSSGDCQCAGIFRPGVAGGCATAQGKCFLQGAGLAACLAGARVDSITSSIFNFTLFDGLGRPINTISGAPTVFPSGPFRRNVCSPLP